MKKLILIAILATAFTCGLRAQDTINYIVIINEPSGSTLRPGSIQKMLGFRTQTTLTDYLNSLDSTVAVPAVFDVRTKKPLKASFSTEVVDKVVTVRERRRKWDIKP